ncbi:hypothetical protein Ddye_017633 [Dipteronia dyeriana]|uniref:BED-type domain-containing protein n=1 Tax=Dipteronia dyeriana TaxID=168575 RepID=A0AAD9WZZ3_9ROSI|nr:hypothetical protein Ddye_017633 [Dipteronia dyeriana]
MNPEDFNLNLGDQLPDEDINRLYGEFLEEGPASTTGVAGPSSSTPKSSKKRKKKSIVWDCFDSVMKMMPDGRQVQHACCKYFKSILTSSCRGTSYLKRHRLGCMASHGQVDTTRQTQLQQNPNGLLNT